MINNKPAFHNLCESAFEWAWNALGIEEDYIYAEDFYAIYDKTWAMFNASMDLEAPSISMLEIFKESTTPWVYNCDED